jgi:hypothetical protein
MAANLGNMDRTTLANDGPRLAQDILGYLNFSSGAADPHFLANINRLFGLVQDDPARRDPPWQALRDYLTERLAVLHDEAEAFREVDQAVSVLRLALGEMPGAYRQFHRDLLRHQSDEMLFQPFLLARMCEAVLRQGSPWEQTERIIPQALQELNDYLGYRPVAVLRSRQKIQPYAHEWVRPIPLYIRGAGVAMGPYHDLVAQALAILEATDADLLEDAMFDPRMLEELALDPRACDFDHPVYKRPNYLFGQWDLGQLDNAGNARRFIVQQISLDAMLGRLAERGNTPYDEALFEEAALLAGTMLMGSGVSGNRPESHDSTVTLATLVQRIATFRDAFYDRLLARVTGPMAQRLRAEAVAARQPLGPARQAFNQHLSNRRAAQLQYVHLAILFARMGYSEAAARQACKVPATSVRMKCEIHCRLTAAQQAIEQYRGGGKSERAQKALEDAAAHLAEVEDLLHRAIECGALIDPWNILGFGGQFSLFPAVENSVFDHRVDELIDLMGEIFAAYVEIQKEAAAAGNDRVESAVAQRLSELATWWDKFATVEVGSVEGISGRETCESAEHVAAALRAWHQAGTAAGDLAFWRSRAEQFHSPKSYALVVDALLEQRDPVAAMALLVQWLSQAEQIPLTEEGYSFHGIVLDWMEELWQGVTPAVKTAQDAWSLTRKFIDYLEANAEEYWQVPRFELAGEEGAPEEDQGESELLDPDDIYSAAYEEMSFRDSTDDGFEGEMAEGGEDPTDFELVLEAQRIGGRLEFLYTLVELWTTAAVASSSAQLNGDRDQVLRAWLDQAQANRRELAELLTAAQNYRIPPPRSTQESLMEFDRRRSVKEMLVEQIIATCVETVDAIRVIRAVMQEPPPSEGDSWEGPMDQALRGILRNDAAAVRRVWRPLMAALVRQPLLYVALTRGGNPQRIVASRGLQQMLRRLLAYLPRLGLLSETKQLIETIQEMEVSHPAGPGGITEFDQMFRIGCKGIVRCLVLSSAHWRKSKSPAAARNADIELIGLLEQMTEVLLRSWLAHSRGVRLSVLETVDDKRRWQQLKTFVQRYGHDLFTQRFLGLGNLRAILHQGVDNYLQSLVEEPETEEEHRLLAELDGALPREEAIRWLTVILEAVVENYAEYVDYNSTTTQSDRGEMLFTLLDYLRLRASYDRMAWNLQPVVLTHEVLVRAGRDEAAEAWRQAVGQRTAPIADEHLKRFTRLNRKYGMWLPSIASRLDERFVRPLLVDRLRALVHPAIEEARARLAAPESAANTATPQAFARLEEGLAPFTAQITGAGFDLPPWLDALEQEIDMAQSVASEDDELPGPLLAIQQVCISKDDARRQVKAMSEG